MVSFESLMTSKVTLPAGTEAMSILTPIVAFSAIMDMPFMAPPEFEPSPLGPPGAGDTAHWFVFSADRLLVELGPPSPLPTDDPRVRERTDALHQADAFRIDHFRGFAASYEIPADSPDARIGTWRPGPGRADDPPLQRGDTTSSNVSCSGSASRLVVTSSPS